MKQRTSSNGKDKQVRRTAAERAQLLREYRRSGLTQRRFCEQRSLALATLTLWLRQQRQRKAKASPIRLIPAQVKASDMPGPHGSDLQIVLGNGRVIQVACGASPEAVLPWVQALEQPCGA